MINHPKFLLQHTPEEIFAVHARDQEATKRLLQTPLPDTEKLPAFTLLIAQSDQLYDYVQVIPALAWELLEYAEEPLEMVYPQKKAHYLPWLDRAEICVRWVRQPKLQQLVRKQGPFLTVRPEPYAARIAQAGWDTLSVDMQEAGAYSQVRTILLRADNTFTFLR